MKRGIFVVAIALFCLVFAATVFAAGKPATAFQVAKPNFVPKAMLQEKKAVTVQGDALMKSAASQEPAMDIYIDSGPTYDGKYAVWFSGYLPSSFKGPINVFLNDSERPVAKVSTCAITVNSAEMARTAPPRIVFDETDKGFFSGGLTVLEPGFLKLRLEFVIGGITCYVEHEVYVYNVYCFLYDAVKSKDGKTASLRYGFVPLFGKKFISTYVLIEVIDGYNGCFNLPVRYIADEKTFVTGWGKMSYSEYQKKMAEKERETIATWRDWKRGVVEGWTSGSFMIYYWSLED